MSAGEVRGPLPQGWAKAPIGELCELVNGRAFKPEEWTSEGLPIIRIQNLNNHAAKFNRFSGTVEAKHRVSNGDLLFAWSGTPGTSFGAHLWHGGDAVLNQHIFNVLHGPWVIRDYMRLAMNSRLGSLIDQAHGGAGLAHVTKPVLERTEIPLPPLAEQRRIVVKLDAVMAQVREARAALEAVPALLEQYRRAVLAAAFRGELTADWRAAHPEVEPASALLARIRAQLEQQQGRRSAMREEWNPEAEQGEWGADPLPTEWTWCRMTDICVDATDSERKLPQSEYKAAGIYPVIDQGERVPGGFCSDEALAYSGALPVVVFGDHSRRAHFVDRRFVQGADGTKVLVPGVACAPKFLHLTLLTIRLPDKGYSRHFKFLRASRFPLPPLAEQHEIVRRVEAALGRIARVKEAVEAQRQQLDALERAVLDKAFRGALVPQQPDDEPAEAMLARLRAQRAATGAPRRARRGRGRGDSA